MVARRTVLAATIGAAGALTTAACSSGSGKKNGSANTVPKSDNNAIPDVSPSAPAAATVAFSPAAGAANVSVSDPVTVTADNGTLQNVSVTANGKAAAGNLDTAQRVWRSTAPLDYGLTYTVTATLVDGTGTAAPQTATFTTLKPTSVATVSFPANEIVAFKSGGTYGVGQVVAVRYSKAVKDRAAAEKAMTVRAEPSVEGRWRWTDDRTAHWRPPEYWKPGTKVTVSVAAHGVNLGNNVYGGADASLTFTIGPSKIAIADGNSHYMQVFVDGQMVKNMPVSLGKGGTVKGTKGETINYWTRSGVHVIMEKAQNVRMTSASYGITDPKNPNYYDENISYCCRITYSGEYVHLADWNIPEQGKRNTSHGCINVGPDNAKWFYANFGIGDVVDVKNTPRQMALSDGIGDWTIAWDKW